MELPHPLVHDGSWADDERGPESDVPGRRPFVLESTDLQTHQEGDELDRFPQSHLVPHDAPGLLGVQLIQPAHTRLLVPVCYIV